MKALQEIFTNHIVQEFTSSKRLIDKINKKMNILKETSVECDISFEKELAELESQRKQLWNANHDKAKYMSDAFIGYVNVSKIDTEKLVISYNYFEKHYDYFMYYYVTTEAKPRVAYSVDLDKKEE